MDTVHRIERLLLDAGVAKRQVRRELANACGISPQAVGDWFNGKTKKISPDYIATVAKKWESNSDYLITGVHPKQSKGNVMGGPDIKGRIPLISSVTAGKMCESMDLLAPGDAEEWYPCPVNHSDRAFALRVKGDSMTSQHPGQRSYPSGTIIFVDPDKDALNGSRVVAKVAGSGDSTFKVYAEDMGKKYLKPINTTYPPLDVTELDFHICGVVIGSFLPE